MPSTATAGKPHRQGMKKPGKPFIQPKYETVFGGRDGPIIAMDIPKTDVTYPDGRRNQAGSLKWVTPSVDHIPPYGQFGVSSATWPNGRGGFVVVNVQMHGDERRIMQMAGKTTLHHLEVVKKVIGDDEYVTINLYPADEGWATHEIAIRFESNLPETSGWQIFDGNMMAGVAIGVREIKK